MPTRIVTDSTSDIPKEIVDNLNIKVVPLNVHFGETTYKDGIDISPDEFFQKLTTGSIFPSTSQPSIGEFVEAYEETWKEENEVVSIHISSKLSGTYNSAFQASKELENRITVHLVDSLHASMSTGLAVINAAIAAKEGKSGQECVKIAKDTLAKSRIYVMLDTLEFLEKGGRIGKARSLLGNILKIKPLLTIESGEISEFGKARSRRAGLSKLRQEAYKVNPAQQIAVVYSTDQEDAINFATSLEQFLPDREKPIVSRVGPVIGTHAGPNLIGIVLVAT